MQQISLTEKGIHWFMSDMVVERDIRIIYVFSPSVNWQVPSKIRKLGVIVHTSGEQEDKPYLLFNF